MKKSALAEGLKAAAGYPPPQAVPTARPAAPRSGVAKAQVPTVLIGGHFPPEVRRVLLLVQAEPENAGKNLKQLLGEAINDLCVKYGKPQPYSGEE
jgi:hypothetical protein